MISSASNKTLVLAVAFKDAVGETDDMEFLSWLWVTRVRALAGLRPIATTAAELTFSIAQCDDRQDAKGRRRPLQRGKHQRIDADAARATGIRSLPEAGEI